MAEKSGYPSLAALLGLLAIAGYQNRDKLQEWFGGRSGPGEAAPQPHSTAPVPAPPSAQGGLGGILGPIAGGGLGGLLSGGLGELVTRMRNAGQGQTVDSWVGAGRNEPVDPHTLGRSLGDDVLAELTARTGLSREEILRRLSERLPDAVDRYTPQGRLPQAGEFAS